MREARGDGRDEGDDAAVEGGAWTQRLVAVVQLGAVLVPIETIGSKGVGQSLPSQFLWPPRV